MFCPIHVFTLTLTHSPIHPRPHPPVFSRTHPPTHPTTCNPMFRPIHVFRPDAAAVGPGSVVLSTTNIDVFPLFMRTSSASTPIAAAGSATLHSNITYGRALVCPKGVAACQWGQTQTKRSGYVGKDLLLDFYVPNASAPAASARAALIVVHGGAYWTGTKTDGTMTSTKKNNIIFDHPHTSSRSKPAPHCLMRSSQCITC